MNRAPLLLAVLVAATRITRAVDPTGLPTVDDPTAVGPVVAVPADWAPRMVADPGGSADHAISARTCSGVPSMAITSGGRLWVAWYVGTTPGRKIETCPGAYVVVSTSADGGRTWKEVLAIDPDGPGPLKAMDPRPWIAPDGRLWII